MVLWSQALCQLHIFKEIYDEIANSPDYLLPLPTSLVLAKKKPYFSLFLDLLSNIVPVD